MTAWFDGQFERCLEICSAVRARDVAAVSELALLRARALLRLSRPAEAHRILNDVFVAHGTLDSSVSAQMLLGAAEVRLGDVDAGLARLEAAQIAAVCAHPTIRSEIALNRALAHYARRDYAAATEALSRVSKDSDIIYARALEYRGWIASARGHSDRAALRFVAAIEHLDTCRHQDRFLETNALQKLASIAVETFDFATWDFVSDRETRIDWSADGIGLARWWVTMSAAMVSEAQGHTLRAFAIAREAERLASSPAYRVHALCRRARLSRNVGEAYTPADLLQQARSLFDALPADGLRGNERTVPLILAEEIAHAGDALGAKRLYSLYRSLDPIENVIAMSGEPDRIPYEQLVEATIAAASEDVSSERGVLRRALDGFRKIGYTRRAAECALRLADLTNNDRLYQYALEATRDAAPSYWVRRFMERRERFFSDPIAQSLNGSQREVLDLILQGRTNREIAHDRGRSVSNVKHAVTALLKAFGLRNRSELQLEAVRRFAGRTEPKTAP